MEVTKQRKQALIHDKKLLDLKLLYRGYWSTVLRDMPFSIVQFSLWEYFKKSYSFYTKRKIYPVESAICGATAGFYIIFLCCECGNKIRNYSCIYLITICIYFIISICKHYIILGGISAAVTTPLDVVKTRIMLANRTLFSSELKILNILHGIYLENGFHG